MLKAIYTYSRINVPVSVSIKFTLMDRMGSPRPIFPIKRSVTIDTMSKKMVMVHSHPAKANSKAEFFFDV